MNTYTKNYWTSDLIISSSKDLSDVIPVIEEILPRIGKISTKWGERELPDRDIIIDRSIMKEYSLNGDNTCMMKGVAIDNIVSILESNGINDYSISFGGDIYINTDKLTEVHIDDAPKFTIYVKGKASVFTSGNNYKRGNHIIGAEHGVTTTAVVIYPSNFSDTPHKNQVVDAMATKISANETNFDMIKDYLDGANLCVLNFKDGKLINNVYCASPFFDQDQIDIRDRMISEFTNIFRPDQREVAKKYNGGDKTPNTTMNVVLDNETGIEDSDLLVFPNRTDDLGTLFEVGYAIGVGRSIIKFNEETESYSIIPHVDVNWKDIYNDKFVFDCKLKTDVISLGICAGLRVNPENLLYQLSGEPDNIMLSVNYTHVEDNIETNTLDVFEKKYIEDRSRSAKVGSISLDEVKCSPNYLIDFSLIYGLEVYEDSETKVVTSVS